MADVVAPISIGIGTGDSWLITPRARNRAPLANQFSGGDVLYADVWPGGNQAAIFSPTIAWVDPAVPKCRLSISSTQSATVEEGIYHIAASVQWDSGDGQRHDFYYGLIEFYAGVGSASVPTVYCTISDLRTFAPEIEKIMSRTKDLTGFSGQRHAARVQFENRVINRFSPLPGRSRRYMNEANSGPGPYMRLVRTSPTGSTPPTSVELQALFDNARLILNGTVIQANAYLAASLVFQDQIVGSGQSVLEYQALAKMYRQMWEQQFDACLVEFDTTNAVPASSSIIQVDRDIVYLT